MYEVECDNYPAVHIGQTGRKLRHTNGPPRFSVADLLETRHFSREDVCLLHDERKLSGLLAFENHESIYPVSKHANGLS